MLEVCQLPIAQIGRPSQYHIPSNYCLAQIRSTIMFKRMSFRMVEERAKNEEAGLNVTCLAQTPLTTAFAIESEKPDRARVYLTMCIL